VRHAGLANRAAVAVVPLNFAKDANELAAAVRWGKVCGWTMLWPVHVGIGRC